MQSRALLIAALAVLCSACAEAPIQLGPRMVIVNELSATITEVRYRACGESSPPSNSLALEPLAGGQAVAVDFPLPCADFTAFFANGRIAGTQSNIKSQYPLRWVLR